MPQERSSGASNPVTSGGVGQEWREEAKRATVHRGPLSAYFQIAEFFRDRIRSEIFPIGSQIPTETEILEAFEVSRHTARNAIQQLFVDGLVAKFPGRGTFVVKTNAPSAHWTIDTFQSFLSQSYPGVPEVISIGWERFRRTDYPLPSHRQWNDDSFLRVKLVRKVNGVTISFALIDVPREIGEAIQQIIMAGPPKIAIMSIIETTCGIRIEKIRTTTRAMETTEDLADILGIANGGPVLSLHNSFFDGNNFPVELSQIFFRPDAYEHNFEILRA